MDPETVTSSSVPEPTSEVIQLFIAGILPAIRLTVLCGAWIGVLVCLLLALIHFSTRALRKRPLFIMNMIAICTGIVCNILELSMLVVNTTSVNDRSSVSTVYTVICLSILSVILTDSILLYRLLVVFPFERTPRSTFLLIFGPLGLIKIGRLAIAIIFLVIYIGKMNSSRTPGQFYNIGTALLWPRLLWGIQLLDNGLVMNSEVYCYVSYTSRHYERIIASFPQRLRTLFWIGVSNFVFPSMFAIAQLVTFTKSTSFTTYLMINVSDIGVEITGVLFATLWASSSNWLAEKDGSNQGADHTSMQFAQRQTLEGTLSFNLDPTQNSNSAIIRMSEVICNKSYPEIHPE
ncbi:hypothetical protein K435DRAFT_700287 [Dendrothele bispora CBS 962.96]|uniref:G-protein coupled receptors family 1 profile domain-containing protein n=1 Tax=Dendrothele bispora (strain CBS 962.96) TaxID=1314807 RepID=A0A4V4HB77_DENBC|nr:hypothetical protein K435DRAFT_700287 [Dendrothele bispora CBS 962.96]